MEPMNSNTEQRVWSRVMNAQSACARVVQRDAQDGARSAAVLDEDALMELYTGQMQAACTYRHLAAMTRGRARQTLTQLAEAKRCHAKRTEAMYYVRTGKKPCPDRPKSPCVSCVNEALRQAYQEELCTAELYRRYARNADDFACVLEQMATESCRHAQLLLSVLQECL